MRVSKLTVKFGREEIWLFWEKRKPWGPMKPVSAVLPFQAWEAAVDLKTVLLRVRVPACTDITALLKGRNKSAHLVCLSPGPSPLTCEPCPPHRRPPWTAGTAPGPWPWLCRLCSTTLLQGQGGGAGNGESCRARGGQLWPPALSFSLPLLERLKPASYSHTVSWAPGLGIFSNSLF